MCLAQGLQCSDPGKAQTRGPSVSRQALYQWATGLPVFYSKTVLSGHSQIDKTKILMTNGSLMKVESIQTCIKQSLVLKTNFGLFKSGGFRQVLLYFKLKKFPHIPIYKE